MGEKEKPRPNVPSSQSNTHIHNATTFLHTAHRTTECRPVEQRDGCIAYSHRPASKTARQTGRKTELCLLILPLDLTLLLSVAGPLLKRVREGDMGVWCGRLDGWGWKGV